MKAVVLGLGGLDCRLVGTEGAVDLPKGLGITTSVPVRGYPGVNPAMAWATVLTGLNPGQHGVFDAIAWGADGLGPNPRLDTACVLWEHVARGGYRVLCVGFPGPSTRVSQNLRMIPAAGNHPLALPLQGFARNEDCRAYADLLLKEAREGKYNILAVNLSPVASKDQVQAMILAEAIVEAAGGGTEVVCIVPWLSTSPTAALSINQALSDLAYLRWIGGDGPWWGRIDWRRTRAYSFERGDIRLNLRGREPHGVLDPGPPAYDCALELLQGLGEWRPVPSVGLFHGPYAHWGPDLLIEGEGVAFGGSVSVPRKALLPQGFVAWSSANVPNLPQPLVWEKVADMISRLLTELPFEPEVPEAASNSKAVDPGLRLYTEDLERKYVYLRGQYLSTARWALSLEEELRRKNALLQAVETSWLHRLSDRVRKVLGAVRRVL